MFIDDADELGEGGLVRSGRELRRMLDDPVWDDISTRCAEILRLAPPVFLYIDAIDEEFAHRPMRWLRCQKGLFYATMRLLRSDTSLSSRLHVVIGLRDIVLSSVMKSEHSTRYRNSPHIRSLHWDRLSIQAFLGHKIGSLPSENWFADRPRPRDLTEWIGLSTIATRNGEREPVDQFALRHTQILPRDIILLGNNLAEEVRLAIARGADALGEVELRQVVERVGTACGLAQIVATANQALAEGLEDGSRSMAHEPRQRTTDEYRSPGTEALLEIIGAVESLRFDSALISLLRERGRAVFGCSDLPSNLWQAGLLGYTENEHDVFHRSDFQSSFSVPKGKSAYVFHPTMRECAGLTASGRLVDVV
jgi:hypothetical protein